MDHPVIFSADSCQERVLLYGLSIEEKAHEWNIIGCQFSINLCQLVRYSYGKTILLLSECFSEMWLDRVLIDPVKQFPVS